MQFNLIPIIDIVSYWSQHEDECCLGIDWSEAHERCWRCAYKTRLQRCHIIPASRGGSATADNLVLLCRRCHREAPNVPDPRFMWIWLRATHVPFYDTYWSLRGAQEFKAMFGHQPFSGPHFTDDRLDKAKAILRSEISRATIHWGEGRLNPSTIASIYALVEEQITGIPFIVPTISDMANNMESE